MLSKKINDLATSMNPSSGDFIPIGDPVTGQLKKVALSQIGGVFGGTGSVSSIGLSMPSAFNVANSPVTTTGIINVTMQGLVSQYLRGNGTIGDLNTTAVSEGDNLYFTTYRARGSFSFVSGSGGYNQSTGQFSIPTNTNQLTNGAGYITSITSQMVTHALGYTPYNSSNPSGFITSITSAMIISALGYTPYSSANPAGYITSSSVAWGDITGKPTNLSQFTNDLGNYGGWVSSSALNGYMPITGGTFTGVIQAPAFYESSDIRYKNVLRTNPEIEANSIEVIEFKYKDDLNGGLRYGYSAQQVQEVLPNSVVEKSDKLFVNYSDVHTLKIAQLEKRILELEAKLK